MTEGELRIEYEKRKPSLQALGDWVTSIIVAELAKELKSSEAAEKFLQIPPRPRVKGTDSFLEKAILRKPKADPLSEITDQVGVRFVVLLLEDIDRIGQIVQSLPWQWQKDRDHEQERLEKPDYFAYQSDHYVVRPKESLVFQGIKINDGMPCEIQIRTILQHAYAEMAHASDYKPSIRLPQKDQRHVRRALSKGSALIETTDDVFKDIKRRLSDYSKGVDALLECSSRIYTGLTNKPSSASTSVGQIIGDTYREVLAELTPEALQAWTDEHPWLARVLVQKRAECILYRDSSVLLLGWLVTHHQLTVPKQWPMDGSYLEDLYTTLGISTSGLF